MSKAKQLWHCKLYECTSFMDVIHFVIMSRWHLEMKYFNYRTPFY